MFNNKMNFLIENSFYLDYYHKPGLIPKYKLDNTLIIECISAFIAVDTIHRMALNVNQYRERVSNAELYGDLPRVSLKVS